ncbi:serine O-acetyltransferase EpsC [Haladaptatus pallidirubidus]|uniref:Serine acetyltransferase N-terminal domain-containing protein n=1 Tax=Haladaptatus pallidirubidus TaxID=1008152 RepID=A0AAV3UPP3_9EURY|nr:serine O-acetyltransferase EpsC [Haladaptatus pallidirubidus]
MEYRYTGNAHHSLVAAYEADKPPFPVHEPRAAPETSHARTELSLLHRLLFPSCWNAYAGHTDPDDVQEILTELGEQLMRGCQLYAPHTHSQDCISAVIDDLPNIRERLKRDVEAAYKGDPAAKSYLEVIRAYPGFHAIVAQRVAHELYKESRQEYARELTEAAKSDTGIDIHPGAEIGDYFFIDHGTGVVIGETATIGDWCRLYQNVTLGALHFEEEEDTDHALKKGYKRHPDIGDHVVIGAGTNVLGAISVGNHVSIGANSWITEDIPANTTVYVSNHPDQERKSNGRETKD